MIFVDSIVNLCHLNCTYLLFLYARCERRKRKMQGRIFIIRKEKFKSEVNLSRILREKSIPIVDFPAIFIVFVMLDAMVNKGDLAVVKADNKNLFQKDECVICFLL